MDFWDITKLLVRRWMVAVPLLLLSAGITGVTVSQVKPDYVATAYVQLVPPAAIKVTNPEQAMESGAPLLWPDLGTNVAYHFVREGGDVDGVFVHG